MQFVKDLYGELRRWLARRQSCSFYPLNDAHGADRHWQLSGGDPALAVVPEAQQYPRGWYMLEIRMQSDMPMQLGKLYVDYGDGFAEETCFPLAVPAGQLVKRLCYFPRVVQALRFDPSECPATVEFQQFVLARVTSGFAHKAMLRKLAASPYVGADQLRVLKASGINKQEPQESSLWQEYHKLLSPSASADYDTIVARERLEYNPETVANRIKAFTYQPLISIVVPVYNTRPDLLERCIASVRAQHYQNWQLCLADDASTDESVPQILDKAANDEPRINWVRREVNGHICAASNSALGLARGEFIALLDHDDELAPHALLEVVAALQVHTDARIVYSDEDKLGEDGRRCEPHFKPDWNPDLLYAQNFVSHLGVYHADLVRTVGGFRAGFEGSQDYDLLLRCVEMVRPEQVVHIPRVLYHWRATEGSTALDSGEKDYTTAASIAALTDHFRRKGQVVDVSEGIAPNTFRVQHPVPEPQPLVTLLIPTRDGYEILKQCIDSIIDKTTYRNYEILVLNNQSSCEQTLQYFQEISARENVRVVDYDYPFNYSAMNNFGVAQAKGDIVGLVNNDIEVISPEWLDEMVSHVAREEIGCVGAKLYYPNDTVQHAGVVLGLGGVAGHSHKHFPRTDPGYFYRLNLVQNYSAVTAACLLVRKSVFEEVGGLDEENLTIAFNDVDFCLKVREAGYRNLWTPYAELYHHESISRGDDTAPEKAARFQAEINHMRSKWSDVLLIDPAYNRNLTLDYENFSLR
ncbi:glycosyltransferase family 2 protein [Microbulbifer harenosus]|uniref:Glycosyltransferase family 2 protein n=1 Tax=Microbulbifer harenosus TaxID=2576840 RepID=A0ABY2UN26_9GAMM|nr:glycosyltransferase family 2 protein [Microbulbifer harenosus]TLM80010.1 glycosyltransferase family 2 protein [Microbulbifer harenosus]